MKLFTCTLITVVALVGQNANADSIRNFKINNVSIGFGLNDGGGGNAIFSLKGPLISISGAGGTGCDWCNITNFFSPGASLTPSIPFFGFDTISTLKIGGVSFDPALSSMGSSSIFALKGFNFPAGAVLPSFSVLIPATFTGPVAGVAGNGSQFIQFRLHLPAGKLALTFTSAIDLDGLPAYQLSTGSYIAVVPEPGTLALAAVGLLGIALMLKARARKLSWGKRINTQGTIGTL
jgi:PEP-CTERM motif